MKLSERISAAVRDVVVPELRALRDGLRGDFWLLRRDVAALRRLMLAVVDRLEERIDGRTRESWRRTPCHRSPRGCRLRRPH